MAILHTGGPWWPGKLVTYQVAVFTFILVMLARNAEGQATYKLEVNENTGDGIFVSYYQVNILYV